MRFRGERSRLRRRLGVESLTIVGGLLVLLMMTGVACDDSDSKATGEPTAPSPGLTGTATSQPPVAVERMPSPTPVPRYPILEAAVVAMRNVDSFHFVQSSKRSVDVMFADRLNAEAIEATGDYQSPDRLHKRAAIHYVDSPTTSHVQAISIGDTRYVTNPDTGEWERSRESGRGEDELFSNPIDFFEGVVSTLGPNAYQGISTFGGVKVHRFVYATSDPGSSFHAVVVVGVDDSLVREVRQSSSWRQRPCHSSQPCPAILIVPGSGDHSVDFSYPDEAVTIQAPQIHIGSPTPPTVPTASEELRSAKERAALAATDSALANLVQGNSAFALDLYQNLRDKDGNLFCSPYSISLALAMTYAGASGETERQMADTLQFLLVQEDLHPAFNALDLKLASRGEGAEGKDDEGFRLNIVNALWGQGGCSFLPEFLDVLGESYGAGVRPLNFLGAPEESRTTINDWVSEQTEDRIKDLIPEGGISPSTVMVLTNAIYFNAAWLHPFEPEDTRNGQFHLINGNTVDVPMMRQTETFGYVSGEWGYQALELLYDGGELSMVILLPDRGSFSGFEESLDAEVVNGATSRMSFRPVSLTMPKFEFESSFSLANTLKSMGMPDAFDRSKANLSGMGINGCPGGGGNPFISDVVHKAFVLVEEEGTEAAAATGVVVRAESIPPPPIEVSVDRPFIFLIRDRETDAVLFVGRVLDPRE